MSAWLSFSYTPVHANLFPGRTEVDIFRQGKDFRKKEIIQEDKKEIGNDDLVENEKRAQIEMMRKIEAYKRFEDQRKSKELQERLKIAEIWGQKTINDRGEVSYSMPPEYAMKMMLAKSPQEKRLAQEEYLKIRMEKNKAIGEAATGIQEIAYEKYITPDVFYNDPAKTALKQKHSEDLRNILVDSGPQGRYINDEFKLVDEKDRKFEGKRIPGDVNHPVQVIYFYDIDCHHCNKIMPIIEDFAMKYDEYMDMKGVYVGENSAKMAAYLYHRKEAKDPIPFENYGNVYYKEKGLTYSDAYGIKNWPTVLMINTKTGQGLTVQGSDKNLSTFVKALELVHKEAQI